MERRLRGRAVRVLPDGSMYVARGFALLRSTDDGRTWRRVAAVPRTPARMLVERSRLATRLLRHTLRALVRLDGGELVVATRTGVFHGREGGPPLRRSVVEGGGQPVYWPMRLGQGPGDVVVWGEYDSSRRGVPLRLFASRDGGRSFQVVHTFAPGEIGHVHNIVWDGVKSHYWVLAGDHGQHPGIGRLSADLRRFEWYVRGSQRYRAVEVFDLGDRLLYATDTEVERNALISLDKESGRSEVLRTFEGSCIYACRFGSLLALTTTVEPSPVNEARSAGLWISRDGASWRQVLTADKDRWPAGLFQFGSLVLPSGSSTSETLLLSGQAVEGLDGVVIVASLRDI